MPKIRTDRISFKKEPVKKPKIKPFQLLLTWKEEPTPEEKIILNTLRQQAEQYAVETLAPDPPKIKMHFHQGLAGAVASTVSQFNSERCKSVIKKLNQGF